VKVHNTKKRFLAFLLALALMFSTLTVAVADEYSGSESASVSESSESSEPESPSSDGGDEGSTPSESEEPGDPGESAGEESGYADDEGSYIESEYEPGAGEDADTDADLDVDGEYPEGGYPEEG